MQIEKKGFTPREKKLLLAMFFVAFTAGMVMLIILPLIERLQDQRDRYDDLSLAQMQMQMQIIAADATRAHHTRAITEFDQARDRYLNESHISEIGRMMTLLAQDHGFLVFNQQLPATPTIPQEWDAFMVMPVSMSVSGTYDNLLRLLDTVEHREYIRVTRVSFTLSEDDAGAPNMGQVLLNFEVIMMQALGA